MDVDMEYNRCGDTNVLCMGESKSSLYHSKHFLVNSRGDRDMELNLIG